MTMHTQVYEFQKTFKSTYSDTPILPSKDVRNLRIKILEEEFNEFYQASSDNDIVEIADALGDIAYVDCGTAITYGLFKTSYTYEAKDCAKYDPVKSSEYMVRKLKKAFADYSFAEIVNNLSDIEKALNNIIDVVSEISCKYDIPLQLVFDEIHRSNMSKLDKNGNPIFREDGKIMKSELYFKPDICKILEDYWITKGYSMEYITNMIGEKNEF